MHWLINFVVAFLVYDCLLWLNSRTFKLETENGGCIQIFISILPIGLLDEHKYLGLMGAIFGLWMFIVDVSFPWLAKKFDPFKK